MARATRKTPGCILFLLDCSSSMYGEKSENLAKCVNETIQEFISVCTNGAETLDRFHIGAIRYGNETGNAIEIDNPSDFLQPVSALEQMPLPEDPSEIRQWVKARAGGGTPMKEAFEIAYGVLEKWTGEHPDSPRPTVINVTDGQANDLVGTQAEAEKLRSMKTADGEVFVFNIHISENKSTSVVLPTEAAMQKMDLGRESEFANGLFKMSSELTNEMVTLAETVFPGKDQPKPGAKGFAFNAQLTWLPKLFQIGTMAG